MMLQSAEQNRSQLINEILLADSSEEVSSAIHSTLNRFEQDRITRENISIIVEKNISDLLLFNPMNKEPQQWSNIKLAKVLLNRIKSKILLELN